MKKNLKLFFHVHLILFNQSHVPVIDDLETWWVQEDLQCPIDIVDFTINTWRGYPQNPPGDMIPLHFFWQTTFSRL